MSAATAEIVGAAVEIVAGVVLKVAESPGSSGGDGGQESRQRRPGILPRRSAAAKVMAMAGGQEPRQWRWRPPRSWLLRREGSPPWPRSRVVAAAAAAQA